MTKDDQYLNHCFEFKVSLFNCPFCENILNNLLILTNLGPPPPRDVEKNLKIP